MEKFEAGAMVGTHAREARLRSCVCMAEKGVQTLAAVMGGGSVHSVVG